MISSAFGGLVSTRGCALLPSGVTAVGEACVAVSSVGRTRSVGEVCAAIENTSDKTPPYVAPIRRIFIRVLPLISMELCFDLKNRCRLGWAAYHLGSERGK